MDQIYPTKSTALAEHVKEWWPEPVRTVDIIRPEQLVQLSRTLDFGETRYVGLEVPILGHWTAFNDWPPSAALGSDGHPEDGHFLPPIPQRRRMFAGATVTAHRPLLRSVETVRLSSVESVTPKRGVTGELIFVALRHEFEQNGHLCRTELQNLVYRSGGDNRARMSDTPPSQAEPDANATWTTTRSLPPTTLFRFSALTANAHRIHYDAAYATTVENYPGLVVHGPLVAMLMAHLVERAWGESAVGRFSFRLQRPIFVDSPFVVEGFAAEAGNTADMAARAGAHVAATATAVRG